MESEERQRQFNLEFVWDLLSRNFIKTAPHRFISGVALTSRKPNSRGSAFVAAGAQFNLPIPLLFDHDWIKPVGKVTAISVRGDELHFTAQVANGELWCAKQLWQQLKVIGEIDHGVSLGPAPLPVIPSADGAFDNWRLDEISIVPSGADRNARVLRVWERSHVVRLYAPMETVYWSEK